MFGSSIGVAAAEEEVAVGSSFSFIRFREKESVCVLCVRRTCSGWLR